MLGIKEKWSLREENFPWTFLSGFAQGEVGGKNLHLMPSHKREWRRRSFSIIPLSCPLPHHATRFFLPLFKRKYVSLNGFHLHRHNFASVVRRSLSSGILFLLLVDWQCGWKKFSILFCFLSHLQDRMEIFHKDSLTFVVCFATKKAEVWDRKMTMQNLTRVFHSNSLVRINFFKGNCNKEMVLLAELKSLVIKSNIIWLLLISMFSSWKLYRQNFWSPPLLCNFQMFNIFSAFHLTLLSILNPEQSHYGIW